MLDFSVLQQQLSAMVAEQPAVHRSYAEKTDLARQTLSDWSERWQALAAKIARSRTSWLLAADIREPLRRAYPQPPLPEAVTAIATDGSQILPDRHELAGCYLLNIGIVVLHYGTGERPLLTNRPQLFYREEDTYREWNGRRIAVNTEIVSARRSALEIRELAIYAEQTAPHHTLAGLSDGTLILWPLEGKPRDFQQEILSVYRESFDAMQAHRMPFLGYISQPRSADVVNVLRVALCPENPTNCDKCPYKAAGRELPCAPLEGVTDAALFAGVLREGERSPIFKSSSAILADYGPHTVYFFYVHVGPEVARVEIPQWVARDAALLDFVHAVVYDQARKGQGYPVSLAEAHEQAVIRGPEREQFYRLLEHRYVRQGLTVTISRKAFKKRHASI
jgi:hypothetical protein